MLILQRKKDQSLVIQDNIHITVVDMGNDWVKLAIDAPRDISILRSELIEAAKANKEACTPLPFPASEGGNPLDAIRKLWKNKEK